MQEISIRFNSRILCLPISLNVLLPETPYGMKPDEFYAAGKKYKVLWLLHGGWQDCRQWLDHTTLRDQVEDKNVICVLPSALNSDYGSYPDFGSGFDYPKFFFEELMPFIYSTFPASDKREDNFLTGQSMGGFGTMYFTLLHPEKFEAVAPLSFSMREPYWQREYSDMTSGEFRAMVMADRKKFPADYGRRPEDGIGSKELNLICKYPTVGEYINSDECLWEYFPRIALKGNLPRIFIGCGKEDGFYPKLVRFKEYAESLGVTDITYQFDDGYGHVYPFFEQILPQVLKFFGI